MNFEDISIAFSSKNDAALQKANFIFSLINYAWLSKIATGFIKFAFKIGLPIEGAIKKTVFYHFCGGESIKESQGAIQLLAHYKIGTILDYSVEGEDSEEDYNDTMEEIILTIENARHTTSISFCVFKVTGLGSAALLEKIQHKNILIAEEQVAWEKVKDRVDTICKKAHTYNIAVLIDAEESWIQASIDSLAYSMMEKYNQQKPIVFNTFQLYRIDSLANLKLASRNATVNNYFLGAKLVRGAYMEKERERAKQMDYPSPIYPTKHATDIAYNLALDFCIENTIHASIVCGSHNEYSNAYLTDLMAKSNISASDNRVWFAQLYGMGDNISFNLANAGYNVAKYVPYGPIKSVMPYLFRRAQENTSVAGQSSRELKLIRKEIKRRKEVAKV